MNGVEKGDGQFDYRTPRTRQRLSGRLETPVAGPTSQEIAVWHGTGPKRASALGGQLPRFVRFSNSNSYYECSDKGGERCYN